MGAIASEVAKFRHDDLLDDLPRAEFEGVDDVVTPEIGELVGLVSIEGNGPKVGASTIDFEDAMAVEWGGDSEEPIPEVAVPPGVVLHEMDADVRRNQEGAPRPTMKVAR